MFYIIGYDKNKNQDICLVGGFMKKINDINKLSSAIENCIYSDVLNSLSVPIFLIEYEKGETISSSYRDNFYFQIVVSGNLSIYFIRDDGSAYNLSTGSSGYVIGEMDLFSNDKNSVVVEALDNLITIAIDINTYKEELMTNIHFVQFCSSIMAKKIISIMNSNAIYISLSERVLNYLHFKCDNQTLHGIEKSAFKLHCSSRQLQRILNKFEGEGVIEKIGKGTYRIK